ncbi:zinc finger CCCH domain-containing protein 14 isoform X2 [Macrosteles quadrilineatus]|uniref:zinc finger CCCH domain-containing protein 14 isoform X2 n=1 Tax=Macrosteles quadrilineatus TaxID=74068 RepID=UPI0023E3473C|nr:zinc finger CCCH domain-containing protein 14 isoform X2 [Macrosteles quadrilineatus]
MEGVGAEVSQKIRSAIKAKFKEIGLHVDEELPDYVMVMVANKRSKEEMDEDLQLFLGKHTSLFTTWLHQVLQKLQAITVKKLEGMKRKIDEGKSSDEPKKKKKVKQGSDEREISLKKKIKEEPKDKDVPLKSKEDKKGNKNDSESDDDKEENSHDEKSTKKQKSLSKSSASPDRPSDIDKSKKQKDDSRESSHEKQPKKGECSKDGRRKSLSTSSQVEDIDDEDCINIRTDGELLDTTEDAHLEESNKTHKKKENSKTVGKPDKDTTLESPERVKDKPKSSSPNILDKNSRKERPSSPNILDKNSRKERPLSPNIRSLTPPNTPPKTDNKVLDARELLNRKKAAKQANAKARSRSRSRDRDRSLSPIRKRKDEREARNHHQDRGHKRGRDDDKESSNRRYQREEDRDQRGRDRDLHARRKDDWPRKLESDRIDQKSKERRRESRIEPQSKLNDRAFKDRNDELPAKRKHLESPKRKNIEEGTRRPAVVSRVVPRVKEPEDDTETSGGVPSVVKVTPRPRRLPSQQPSTSLILRAISEANKSLATAPQRPDSTQLGRKKPVFTRLRRQQQRIPPEKIAIEITNPLAIQAAGPLETKEDDARSVSPIPKDKSGRNMSPPPELLNKDLNLSEQEVATQNSSRSEIDVDEPKQVEPEEMTEEAEDEIDLEPSQDLLLSDEAMDDTSEPQFVVTLNGFDPDGIFSQSEIEDDEEPLLTSTPDEVESPRSKREVNVSSNIVGTAAVNHNNLIEVEILRSKSEKCKYWPACRLGDKCTYYHPTKPCNMFPNCKFGDDCLYIHPQCKFNALCTRKDCVFAHTNAQAPVQPTVVAPKAKALYAASAPPCKFFPNCTNIHCQFSHPARPCRFGLYCTKKDCPFQHGQVAPVDKLKWTRVTSS